MPVRSYSSTTKFALRIPAKGTSMIRPCTSIFTRPSLQPASRPSKNLLFSTGSVVEMRASRPANRSNSPGLRQLAIQARRADFQHIARSRHQILDVQQHAQLLAYGLAVAVADALGLVDEHPQESLLADLPFDVDNFYPSRMRSPFGRVANALQFQGLAFTGAARRPELLANKKVGSRPLGHATGFNPAEYSGARRQKQAEGRREAL